MIHKTGYAKERHRPDAVQTNVRIVQEIRAISDGLNARHRNVFRKELAIERRKIIELLSKVIRIERLRKSRAELASNLADTVAIFSETLLISKRLFVNRQTTGIKGFRSLSKNLLVLDELFAEVSKYGIVIIKPSPTVKHARNTLLISQIGTDGHKTDNIAMLNERLDETNAGLRRECISGQRGRRRIRRTICVCNSMHLYWRRSAAEIFGTLQSSVRRTHAKMGKQLRDITNTTTLITLQCSLQLERLTKRIYAYSRRRGQISLKA